MFKYILLSISETERERGGETVREERREGDIEDGWKGGHITRASDFFQDWWAEVTHGAKNGGSFSEMMGPSISNKYTLPTH